MGVRNWVMVASLWAMAAAPALAAGPELAGGPAPDARQAGRSVPAHDRHEPSVGVQQYQGRPMPRPAYVAPDEPGYPAVHSYGFRGYDQAVYAAGPGPDAGFQGYDQAVYAAEGQRRYMDGADGVGAGGYIQEHDRPFSPRGPGPRPPPPPPAAAPASYDGADCPPERVGEQVIHCEYRPYWQDATVSDEFTGGVGVVPIGGGGRLVVVQTGGLPAGARAGVYASASASASARGYAQTGGCGACGAGR